MYLLTIVLQAVVIIPLKKTPYVKRIIGLTLALETAISSLRVKNNETVNNLLNK